MPHPSEEGVAFPLVEGHRSSTATGRAVLADAAAAVDPALAARIRTETDWRAGYHRHLRDLLVASLPSPQGPTVVARDGLSSAYSRFVMHRNGQELPLADAVAADPLAPYGVVTVVGQESREGRLTVPYAGRRLEGGHLLAQLEQWTADGIVEPSHAEAVARVVANPDWLDLRDVDFALLGAAAEMSPLRALLRWGASVWAVDMPDAALWTRLLGQARDGAGRLHVPVRDIGLDAADPALPGEAGADLMVEAAAVREWLTQAPARLVVGNYVYADGAAFARLGMAVDAVSAALLASRPDSVLAALATPTDVFAVPAETVAAARARYADRGWRGLAQSPVQVLSGRRLFRPNYLDTVSAADGRRLGVADCLVVQQGPNYALAKTVQRWRALVAHAEGGTVSANVAPPTRTRSVLRNRVLAAAYAGARQFGVEVFSPATSATLMAALLVHDLRNPPGRLDNPHDLYASGANHGGLWRVPYEPRSVLGLAVMLGLVDRR